MIYSQIYHGALKSSYLMLLQTRLPIKEIFHYDFIPAHRFECKIRQTKQYTIRYS